VSVVTTRDVNIEHLSHKDLAPDDALRPRERPKPDEPSQPA
jgi:hypothetical protein